MTSLKALKALVKDKIIQYYEDGFDGQKHLDPEFLAEELLNNYPKEFSCYRNKKFKKFLFMVKINIKENNFSEICNKKINDVNEESSCSSNNDSFSDDDYSMPKSSHNLNDWITSNYKKPSIPEPQDFFVIDKTGEQTLKRKEKDAELEPNKKIKSENYLSIKTPQSKKSKVSKAQIPQSNKKEQSTTTHFEVLRPQCDFSELEGLEEVISKLKCYLQVYSLGSNKLMRRGFLFSGAAGTGKTTLAKCMSHHLQIPLLVASSSQLLDGLPSERSEKVDKLFEEASNLQPCFVLVEKIEILASDTKEHNVTSLLCERLIKNIDDLNDKGSDVWLIGTTSKLENIEPQLLKNNRFQKCFHLPLPSLNKRINLLRGYINNYITQPSCNTTVVVNNTQYKTSVDVSPPDAILEDTTLTTSQERRHDRPARVFISPDCTTTQLAEKTPSFSAADLKVLVEEAFIHCLVRHTPADYASELSHASQCSGEMKVEVTMADFEKALAAVKPSTMSEDLVSVPEVTWDSIGALAAIRNDLSWLILKHIKHPEVFERDQLPLQGGVMLYGPPGCGKTLIAKAIANEACLNFISVAGPELKDKYVGESERNIRKLFRRAQECAPCLIFFDEIDSLCSTRGFGAEASSGVNVVQQMLTELDGVKERKGVFVMGATNRIDQVDPAFLRENRFGTRFYVGLPTPEGRHEILQSITRNGPIFSADVDLRAVAFDVRCDNLNGADLQHLVREATLLKLKRQSDLGTHEAVNRQHIEEALNNIKPSVSPQHLSLYQNMASKH